MINFTQGDDQIQLVLYAVIPDTNGVDQAVDLTGATFSTQIKGTSGNVTIGNSAHSADPDQVNNKGKFTVTLSSTNTTACQPGSGKEIVTQIVKSGVTLYYHGRNILNVLPSAPIN